MKRNVGMMAGFVAAWFVACEVLPFYLALGFLE